MRFAAFAVVVLTGCAGATVTTLKQAPPKAADCQFDIFTSENEVGRSFETLCVVEGYTGTGVFDDRTINGAIAESRLSLCQCGADAAILVSGASDTSSSWAPAAFKERRGNAVLKGIKYIEARNPAVPSSTTEK